MFVSVKDADKPWIDEPVRLLLERGFSILATDGTGVISPTTACPPRACSKVLEGRPHIVDRMKDGDVQLVFNTTEGASRWRTASRCVAPP